MRNLTRKATTVILALSLALPLAGLPASAETLIDAATQAKVTETLTAEGYEVRRIDSEDGMIEVYAIKDGKKYEIYLDADLKIVKIKDNG